MEDCFDLTSMSATKDCKMLILSRRPGEEILIGDNIRLKIVATRGNRIQVAIDAPSEVAIRRAELEFAPSHSQPTDARKSA